MRSIAYEIASRLAAIANCERDGNSEWQTIHSAVLAAVVREFLPSGSGVDNGTQLDESASTSERLVFLVDFHHMDDAGMYDGWTSHKVIVTPSLLHGIHVRVTGRDRDGIRDYLAELYGDALTVAGPSLEWLASTTRAVRERMVQL